MDNKKLSPVSNNSHQSETIKVSISKGKATLLFNSFFLLFMSKTFHEPRCEYSVLLRFNIEIKGFPTKGLIVNRTIFYEAIVCLQAFVVRNIFV